MPKNTFLGLLLLACSSGDFDGANNDPPTDLPTPSNGNDLPTLDSGTDADPVAPQEKPTETDASIPSDPNEPEPDEPSSPDASTSPEEVPDGAPVEPELVPPRATVETDEGIALHFDEEGLYCPKPLSPTIANLSVNTAVTEYPIEWRYRYLSMCLLSGEEVFCVEGQGRITQSGFEQCRVDFGHKGFWCNFYFEFPENFIAEMFPIHGFQLQLKDQDMQTLYRISVEPHSLNCSGLSFLGVENPIENRITVNY